MKMSGFLKESDRENKLVTMVGPSTNDKCTISTSALAEKKQFSNRDCPKLFSNCGWLTK